MEPIEFHRLHGQETPGNPLSAEPSQPAASVDLDFLEDDILGSPAGAGAGAEQPCDILQQSLQEANITEQTLEAEAELDLGSFQLPALQPVVQAADGTPQIFSGGADLLGLQPPAVLAPQALVQPPDVVNKAISVQPFLQQVGLGNVTIQPLPNLPGLPNGSPGGALGLGPIQVVGQQVMAINQPAAPQLLAKPAPVAAVGGYIAQPEAAAAQGAGLVIQKNWLHGQETSGNPLSAEPSQPAASVDLDFLEDDILGSPAGAGAGAEQPCDILQQSLQEANITEQTLEAEAELDLGSFQLPALQPVVQAADGTPQIFSGGADLLGLQPPAVLAPQALVQPPDVVNKAISVQPFLQQVGLGNVTIQPLPNLPGLPNGSPGGALGLGPIQVVGQQVMAINQPAAPQLLAKPAPVAAVGGYIAQPEAAAAQGAGLVIQKSLPAVATTTLNGSSVFGGVSAASAQPLTVTSGLGGSLVPAPNVIIHRTPTPIQPKPAGVLQQKLYQITPKPFAAGGALALPGEAPAKAQQNLTFMAGKAAPNVVLQGFPPNVFKPPPPQPPALGKSMSVHVLNQGGSIVIPAQPFQGQNQFLLPGQLAGASAVPLPQPLSALPANVGGQLLPGAGQAHIIAGQSAGAQLLANPALPAQLLNQSLAGQLNLGPVLASPGAAGTAHILSAAPIQLQPGQPAPALFQMPVSLAGTLPSPGSAAAPAPTVIQGVTLASPVAMLNAGEGLGAAAVGIQAAAGPQNPKIHLKSENPPQNPRNSPQNPQNSPPNPLN
ncbi:BRD4-interacting chromatin-remodeling complex-associated protein-like [Pyrgilauda ruficollis]|uniref:BRD4-interacting chromatin-remodeling complex-associated protein-like n=1 Tax=Pyrgilauda ruficollis TaxID=221976 RepID=UPI001B887267|nr:BRD4-interacting chromatin-remodeling complex-associated protein-like [Pyrgilauda ruficollis]